MIFKKWLPLVLLLILFFVFTHPFYNSGFFETDDGEWAIVRLAEMGRELKDRQFPPRWADYLNHGYGYPLFSFTYPFPYYFGSLIRLLGFSLTDSIKAIFVISVFVSVGCMYKLAKEFSSKLGGTIAAIFYLVFPFRLVNLYVRGSIGEIVTLAVFPALLLLTTKHIIKPSKLLLAFTSLLLSILILSHNIMSLLFFPFYLLFIFFYLKHIKKNIKESTIKIILPIIFLGLGLSAHFFIPALLEKKYIILSQTRLTNLSLHYLTLDNFTSTLPRNNNPASFPVGIVHILAFVLALIFIFFEKANFRKYKFLAICILFSSIILLFLTIEKSSFFWRFPPLAWLDFPWRLLTPLGFFMSFSTIFFVLSRNSKIVGFLLAVVAVYTSFNMVFAPKKIIKEDLYYATNDATTTSADELMPIWVKEKPKNRYQQKVEIATKDQVNNLTYNSKSIEFEFETEKQTEIRINTIYFPGWQFWANDKKLTVNDDNPQGIITFQLPTGEYKIKGEFRQTRIRKIADSISQISLLVFVILLLSFRKVKQKAISN